MEKLVVALFILPLINVGSFLKEQPLPEAIPTVESFRLLQIKFSFNVEDFKYLCSQNRIRDC